MISKQTIIKNLNKTLVLLEQGNPDYTKITKELGKAFLGCCMKDEDKSNALASIGAVLRVYCTTNKLSVWRTCLLITECAMKEGEPFND